ncbi:MAG: hypothetical protein WCQ00_03545 [bacterium]
MLSKHIENVKQKSENYRTVYAFTASVLFTGVVASFWVFSFFIPNMGGVANSASVSGAIDGSKEISPTGIVKQEIGGIFDSIKNLTTDNFLGGRYKVQFDNGTLGMSQNSTIESSSTDASLESPIITPPSTIISTTTESGFTVEVDGVSNGNDVNANIDSSNVENSALLGN